MKRTIQIRVPRTAGISMRVHARKHAPSFQNLSRHPAPWSPDAAWTSIGHRAAGSLIERGMITREWFDGSYKFAFVRNPFDRLVSLYEYLRKFRGRSFPDSFGRFVDVVTSESKPISQIGRYNVRRYNQANPQIAWLRWGVDFIGRYEVLDDDWRRLCRAIGMKWKPLPRKNATKRGDYRGYYSDESVVKVARFYAKDIKLFGYGFGV